MQPFRASAWLPGEQRQVVRAGLGQQPRHVEDDALDSARLCQHLGLRGEVGRDDERADLAQRRVALRLLAVADDLLHGRGDGAHALDLDERDAAFGIAAPEVDRADVREALALDHRQPGLDQVRGAREMLVQLALLAFTFEQRLVGERVTLVVVDLLDHDRQRLVGRGAIDADDLGHLAHARRARHVVDGLRAAEGMHGDGAVLLEEHHAVAGRQPGGETAGVPDRAAADEDSHGSAR